MENATFQSGKSYTCIRYQMREKVTIGNLRISKYVVPNYWFSVIRLL